MDPEIGYSLPLHIYNDTLVTLSLGSLFKLKPFGMSLNSIIQSFDGMDHRNKNSTTVPVQTLRLFRSAEFPDSGSYPFFANSGDGRLGVLMSISFP